MKKMMAALLVLVMAVSLAACTQATETIYVQTESLRTIGEAEIKMVYAYSDDGTPISVKTYFNGKLSQTSDTRISGGIQYLTFTDADGNSMVQTITQKLDDSGRVIQTSNSVSGTEVAYTNYTYADNGQVATMVNVTASEVTTTTYTYDDKDNVISILEQTQNAGEYSRKDYEYNAAGDLVKLSTYCGEEALEGYMEASINADRTEQTITYFDAEGKPTGEVVVETYDANGNKIKEVTTVDGEVVMTIINTYQALEVPVKDGK